MAVPIPENKLRPKYPRDLAGEFFEGVFNQTFGSKIKVTLKSPYGDKKVTPLILNFRFWILRLRSVQVSDLRL